MGDHPRPDVSHPLARPPLHVPVCHAPRERRPARLQHGQTQAEVDDWKVRASVSQKVVADLEREALSTSEGSLLIVAAPPRSWEWSLPFAAQPPFTGTDLTARVSIVSPVLIDCCRQHWLARTRQTIQGVVPARICAREWCCSGTVEPVRPRAVTVREDPTLRSQVIALLDEDTVEALDRAMLSIVRRVRETTQRPDLTFRGDHESRRHDIQILCQ